jgi:cilia- and flagella-associated protein 52
MSSPPFRFVASGQFGANSDCIVWDFEGRRLLFRLSEHDYGVVAVAFSHDDKLLATVGHEADNKVLVWDMSNGYIVSVASPAIPSPCTSVCWGGMFRDIKRRDTDNYQLATCGNKQIALWKLDPYQGEMVGERVVAEGRGAQVREYTALGFSEDMESLFAGTTSGDFVVVRGAVASAFVRCCLMCD